MSLELGIWFVIVLVVTFSLSRFIRLSKKYDRKPRQRSPWQKLDQGEDPTVEQ